MPWLSVFLAGGPEDPRPRFDRWAETFAEEFRRLHPASLAGCATTIMATRLADDHTLTSLARRLSVSPRTLRRHFVAEYGCSVRTYCQRLRVLRALRRIHSGKIEAVALEVGYRSKKSFYQASVELTGLRPGQLRQLDASAMKAVLLPLERSLRARPIA